MARAYNTIDADGHILEPLDLWDKYIDPAYRERRPRFTIDEHGKERLTVEGKMLGNPRGSAALARSVCGRAPSSPTPSNMPKGRRVGSTRTPASSTWMPTGSTPLSSTRASACSPVPSRTPGSRPRCAAPITAGSPITASPTPTGCSGLPCCRCSRSSSRSRRCATPPGARMRGGFLRPNPYHGNKMISDPMYEPFWTMAEELDFSIGLRGLDHRDADRRRRPLRDRPRGAP